MKGSKCYCHAACRNSRLQRRNNSFKDLQSLRLRNAIFSSLVRCKLQLTCTNRNLFCVHSFRPYLAFAKLVDSSDISLEFYYPQSTPCKHPVIVLQDVAFTDLHALVEFIYHGEVNVHQRSLSSFLKTAEVLRVSGLTQQQAEETHNVR